MKKLLTLIAILVSLTFPKTAHAQEWRKTAKEFYEDLPFSASVGLEALNGEVEQTKLSIYTGKLNIIAEIPKLPGYLYLSFGRNKSYFTYFQHFTIDDENFVDLVAELESPKLEPCIGSGASFTIPIPHHLKIKLDGSMLAPIDRQPVNIDKLTLFPNGAQLPITSIAQEHVKFDYGWSKIIGKATIIYNRGPFGFSVAGGFARVNANVKINLDEDAQNFVDFIGIDPAEVEKPQDATFLLPTLELGTSVNIKSIIGLSISAGMLQVKGDDGYTPFTILNGTITFNP